jgi:hypothetical protein
VEMHGGTVEARSDGPGTGTEIVMRMPCVMHARDEDAEDQAATDLPQAPLSTAPRPHCRDGAPL